MKLTFSTIFRWSVFKFVTLAPSFDARSVRDLTASSVLFTVVKGKELPPQSQVTSRPRLQVHTVFRSRDGIVGSNGFC